MTREKQATGPPDPPPGARDQLVDDQREANEHLILTALRLHEEADREKAARTAAQRDRARLFDDAGWGVAIVSAPDDRMTAVNAALASTYGYSVVELIGAPLEMLCAPHARAQLHQQLRRLADKGHHLFDSLHVRKDGSEFPCLMEATVTHDSEGRIVSSVYNLRDISERARVSGHVAVTERLAALATMSAGIAHEINNPLAYGLANVSLVREGLVKLLQEVERLGAGPAGTAIARRGEELVAALEDAEAGARRIAAIVASMQTFAAPLDHGFAVVPLPRVLEASLRSCHAECTQRAKVVQDLRQAPPVYCNEDQLAVVFVNLLRNAAAAIPAGSAEQNEIRIVLDQDADGYALVTIRDTGSGIPKDVMARVYHPFFTTQPIGGGSGLGLSIAHRIVAAHGGQLTGDSVVGQGSIFRVRLPPAPTNASAVVTAAATASVSTGRARVLVIDDDPLVGRALRRILEKGNEVVVLTSAKDAVALLEGGAVFDSILCDLMMPDMTGMEFFDWATRNSPRHAERVCFITGGAVDARSLEFIDRMTDRVVRKPFDRARITTLVATMIARGDSTKE